MDETDNLALPYIMPSQAQKHVTHNEALQILDALVQLAVLDRDRPTPPTGPAPGDRHIVGPAASGAWAGREGAIACWQDGAWIFLEPRSGWLAFVIGEAALVYRTGAAWVALNVGAEALQNLSALGIGTTADAANPFSAKLNAALWTALTGAEGGSGDLRYTLNKEAPANVLSLLMQSNYSGRAELGLIGADELALKVSADGAAWTTALQIDHATGALRTTSGSAAAPALKLGGANSGLFADGTALAFTTSGAERARVNGNGLGIGISPDYPLHVYRSGSLAVRFESDGGCDMQLARFSNSSGAPALNMIKGRGTRAAPGQALANDVAFELSARGYDDVGTVRTAARLLATLVSNLTSASAEGRLSFQACAAGSVAVAEIMRLDHAGGLSMFGANPVIDQNRHHRLRAYTVASLPAASPPAQLVYVSDGSSNRRLAVSDGTSWRFPDGAVVS